jgi:hypothetical protein
MSRRILGILQIKLINFFNIKWALLQENLSIKINPQHKVRG